MPEQKLPGPYETEQDTYQEPMPARVREIQQRNFRSDLVETSQRESRQAKFAGLIEACRDAGVEIGAYDRRFLGWLAGYEPSTVQVVIGLITRAHAAGWGAATTEDGG